VSLAAPLQRRSRTGTQVGVLVVLALLALGGHLWYGLRNHFFDLMIYREAMLWWADGHPLYDYARPDATQGHLEFTYPPVGAFLLRPLAWLTQTQANVVFIVVAVGCLAAAVWWLVRPIADRHGWPRWFVFGVAAILATGLEPIRLAFDFGQINFVLWALVVFDLAVLVPRRSRFLGVGIGLATAIKLVPGIFILYLLVSRRYRAAIVATSTAVLVTLLAGAAAPHESAVFWTQKLLHGEGLGQLDYVMNQSINGMLARAVAPDEPSTVIWLLIAVPILVYGMWRARRAALFGDELTGMALAGLTGSLVSPVTWAHHIFWFVPALLALVDTAASPPDRVRSGLRGRSTLIAVAVVVFATVTFSMLQWWEFTLARPGGLAELVLSNWLVLLMAALLPVLPIQDRKDAPLTKQDGQARRAQSA
jgi:alpha-1,2-mannosyltransferase